MKPILFNTEMVRAILEGRKTVTRRVINRDIGDWCDKEKDGTLLSYENSYGDFINPVDLCRYRVGDVLYVRETYMPAGCSMCEVYECYGSCNRPDYLYKADYNQYDLEEFKEDGYKWKPSIHMPKAAARIFLKVTGVRVERLQDIQEDECAKEGIINVCENCQFLSGECDCCTYEPILDEFAELWDSTIKPDQLKYYGWEANPYVWVIEFERVDKCSD